MELLTPDFKKFFSRHIFIVQILFLEKRYPPVKERYRFCGVRGSYGNSCPVTKEIDFALPLPEWIEIRPF